MTLAMLADVALADDLMRSTPTAIVPSVSFTMTVRFANQLNAEDQILVKTPDSVQHFKLKDDVAPHRPVVLQLTQKANVEFVLHIPKRCIEEYCIRDQKKRVAKYVRRRSMDERKRRMMQDALADK